MLIAGLDQFPSTLGPIALTIGNFDGVHLGHQKVLKFLCDKAAPQRLPVVVMTFEPHPQEYFLGDQAPARLFRLEDKVRHLGELGVDYVVSVRFNREFSEQEAGSFAEQVLGKQLQARVLVVGDDFRFGRERRGDFGLLQQRLGNDVALFAAPTVVVDDTRVSSTRIRQTLAAHDFASAADLLGRPFAITGVVERGQALGRTFGFPTANIKLERRVSPLMGVFAARAEVGGGEYQAVANVGTRPTLDGMEVRLEVHLFDYDGDCYDQEMSVCFERWLRDEIRFETTDELQQQIARDAQAAKDYFSNLKSSAAGAT